MLLPDLFLAFIAGGLIGARSSGQERGRRLVLRFAILGLGLPALILFWLWPDWYLHYALAVAGWCLSMAFLVTFGAVGVVTLVVFVRSWSDCTTEPDLRPASR